MAQKNEQKAKWISYDCFAPEANKTNNDIWSGSKNMKFSGESK
jgi:hypothetical protein